jgi:hypothetical protein
MLSFFPKTRWSVSVKVQLVRSDAVHKQALVSWKFGAAQAAAAQEEEEDEEDLTQPPP